MAYIQKRGDSYYAQVRRRSFPSQSRTFPTKSLAQEWARKVEREIDEQKYPDVRPISSVSLASLIERYMEEIGGQRGFGRNKEAMLKYLHRTLGHQKVSELISSCLQSYVSDRVRAGAGGVTIAIDLTYLKGVLKVANELWGIRTDLDAVKTAKASLGYRGIDLLPEINYTAQ